MKDVNKATLEKQTKLTDTFDRLMASKNVSQWTPSSNPTPSKMRADRLSTANRRFATPKTRANATSAISKRYQTRA